MTLEQLQHIETILTGARLYAIYLYAPSEEDMPDLQRWFRWEESVSPDIANIARDTARAIYQAK